MEFTSEIASAEIKNRVVGGAMPRGERFSESSTEGSVTASLDYTPNYDIKYKRAGAVVIKREENREELKKKKKERLKMLLPELTTSEKMNLSVMTADTMTNIGPGAYAPNYGAVEITRNVGLSKASRFDQIKKEQTDLGLNVNYEQVEKKAGRTLIKAPVLANSKLIRKRQAMEEQERLRAARGLAIMLEKEQKNHELPRQAVQIREKTEKERVLELFRLVANNNLDGFSSDSSSRTRSLRAKEGERRHLHGRLQDDAEGDRKARKYRQNGQRRHRTWILLRQG